MPEHLFVFEMKPKDTRCVVCPYCKAPVGQPCVAARFDATPIKDAHAPRWSAAREFLTERKREALQKSEQK